MGILNITCLQSFVLIASIISEAVTEYQRLLLNLVAIFFNFPRGLMI